MPVKIILTVNQLTGKIIYNPSQDAVSRNLVFSFLIVVVYPSQRSGSKGVSTEGRGPVLGVSPSSCYRTYDIRSEMRKACKTKWCCQSSSQLSLSTLLGCGHIYSTQLKVDC